MSRGSWIRRRAQRLPDDDDGAGVAVGNRIASAHGVEVGGESANIVPRNHTPVAAAKAFLDDGEGDGLIHLEERHRGVARVVLEFAHDAVIAALDNLFANVDVRQFFRPQHLHAAGHLILMFRVERIRVLFAFVVVKGCVAIEAVPLFPEAFGGGVVDVFGMHHRFEPQCPPTGEGAEVFGEGFGVFYGIDDDGVGVFAAEVAGVHEVGHEPVPVFFSEVGIEAAFWVFNVVAQFQRRSNIAKEGAARG